MNGTPSSSPCPCTQAQDPQTVSNPPGLAQISYRVDDFTGFRRALLRNLPGEQSISTWRPAQGDLGLQVLEWWAYVADVLTFYNERIANESYLRTAQRPGSLANLVALLGYQPAPAIAATGYLAALRTPGSTTEPLVIPASMRLSSVATPDVPSQTFEVDTAASFTGPSSIRVTLAPDTTLELTNGAPSGVLLAGPVSGINAGDQLVLVEGDFAGQDDNWSLVTVTSLTPAPDPGTGAINTQVAFSSAGWGPAPAPAGPPSPGPGSQPLSRPDPIPRPDPLPRPDPPALSRPRPHRLSRPGPHRLFPPACRPRVPPGGHRLSPPRYSRPSPRPASRHVNRPGSRGRARPGAQQ